MLYRNFAWELQQTQIPEKVFKKFKKTKGYLVRISEEQLNG